MKQRFSEAQIIGFLREAGAVEVHQLPEHVDHPPGPDASRPIDRQALTRASIDDRQALRRPAIRARVEDEVIGPYVIPRGRGLRPGATRHLQARLAPQPIGSFGTHRDSPAREKIRIFR